MFLSVVMKPCAYVVCLPVCGQNLTIQGRTNLLLCHSAFLYFQIIIISAISSASPVSNVVTSFYVTNLFKEHSPSYFTLIRVWFIDCLIPYRVRVRNILFVFFSMKHLFDNHSVQPDAPQLETSNMERERILILESTGMESTYNGMFIRDDAMEYPGQL